MRVGFGYDVHSLVEGRKLWLGGILIPHTHGLSGHSDADVLLHAICDALLGAAALGDIGQHFPDRDESFRDIDSKILLAKVVEMVRLKDYLVSNVDATLALESPKIAPYIPEMRRVISGILGVDTDCVSVKATTTEKLGFEGRREGASAYAVVLLEKLS